jgi:putative transposase
VVPLREIVSARNRRRRELRQIIQDRQRVVDSLLGAKRWHGAEAKSASPSPEPTSPPVKLKRYFNE